MPSKERMYPSRRSCGRFRLASFMQVARRFLLTALCAGLPSVNVCQPLYSRLISLRVVRLYLMASIRTSPNWFLRFYTRVFDKRSTFATSVESRSIIHTTRKSDNIVCPPDCNSGVAWNTYSAPLFLHHQRSHDTLCFFLSASILPILMPMIKVPPAEPYFHLQKERRHSCMSDCGTGCEKSTKMVRPPERGNL